MGTATQAKAPLFTRSALVALIWPLFLEQTLSVTMGMADTLMVAGVGEAAVSSVSLVDSLNILIIQILAALATGGAVVASQYHGPPRPGERPAAARPSCTACWPSPRLRWACLCLAAVPPHSARWCLAASTTKSCTMRSSTSSSAPSPTRSLGCTTAAQRCSVPRATAASACWPALVMNVINIGGQRAVDLWLWHGRCGRGAGYADRPRVCGSVDLVAEPEHPQPAAGGRVLPTCGPGARSQS